MPQNKDSPEKSLTQRMDVHKPNTADTLEVVTWFCGLLREEIDSRRRQNLDISELKRYYGNLLTEENFVIPMGVYGYFSRLQPMLDEITSGRHGLRIMDAGSGYGTESYLFSLMGGGVHGVELVTERTQMADSRLDFFQASSHFPLKIKFINSNIFTYLQDSEPFDVIFIMEAISHIYPPEKFLKMALAQLKEGGKIIITDPNKANPLAWIRSIKIRGSLKHAPHQKFRDPHTNQPVDYGQEKIYRPYQMKKLLNRVGFSVEKIHYSGFMGSSILPDWLITKNFIYKLFSAAQHIFSKIPLLRSLGSIYTIVGSKPCGNGDQCEY